VQQQFAEKFPQTAVTDRNVVRRLIEKFSETGSVLDGEQSGKPSKLNNKKFMDISDSMLQSPSKSSLPTPFISAQRLSKRRSAGSVCK
jgi:hypothetical protein